MYANQVCHLFQWAMTSCSHSYIFNNKRVITKSWSLFQWPSKDNIPIIDLDPTDTKLPSSTRPDPHASTNPGLNIKGRFLAVTWSNYQNQAEFIEYQHPQRIFGDSQFHSIKAAICRPDVVELIYWCWQWLSMICISCGCVLQHRCETMRK